MLNAFHNGLRTIEIPGDPENSQVNYPVNGPFSHVCKIEAYDAITGRLSVTSVWDESPEVDKKRFSCVAKFLGRPGIPPDNLVNRDEFITIHRVGEFNSDGSGEPSGFELRDKDTFKVSWVSFFF